MPTIKLVDNPAFEITSEVAGLNSTLDRYLQSGLVFAFHSFTGQFKPEQNKTIRELDPDDFPLALSASVQASFKVAQSTLNINPGNSAAIDLLAGDKAQDFLKSIQVASAPGTARLSFALTGSLEGGPHGVIGDLAFGLTAGQEVTVTNYCRVAQTDLFADAAKKAISGVTIPHDLEDLRSLPEGAICRIEGKGTLKFSASVQYNFLNNTLASQPLELIAQSLSVKAESGAKLQLTLEHSDAHQLTIAALAGNKVRLGVSVTSMADIETALDFSLGLSGNIGSLDALDFLIHQISPGPDKELKEIRQALPADGQDDLSAQIKKVLRGAMDTSIKASIAEAFEKSKERNHLFLYEVDLTALDAAATQALQSALAGDFTAITAAGARLAGITEIDSFSTLTLTTTHTLTIHLIGILNFSDVSSFMQRAKTALNRDTGEVVLSAAEIKILESNVDTDHLRQVLLRSAIITTAAASSPKNPDFRFKMIFFLRKAHPSVSDIHQFSNALQAVASPDQKTAEGLLEGASKQVGAAGIYLSLNLSKDLSLTLFRNRTTDDFVLAGQRAMKAILANDEASAKRLPLFSVDLAFWSQLRDAGARQNVLALLATKEITDPAAVVDFYGVDWWAQAMGAVAAALASQQGLADAEKHALKESEGGFDIPWALVATHLLIGPSASVESKFSVAPARAVQTAGASGV